MKLYWDRPGLVSGGFLDSMDTWLSAADWRDTEDCSKVRNAAKQIIVFGNRNEDEGKSVWPVFEDIYWADPKRGSTPSNAYGEHFQADWTIPVEEEGDTFHIPNHGLVLNRHAAMRGQIFATFQHEASHHAGFKTEAEADSLENCATRNEEREDSIWEKKDPADAEEETGGGGGGGGGGYRGSDYDVTTECHVCTYERRVDCWTDREGNDHCRIYWVLLYCQYVGEGDCDDYFGFAPGALPGRRPSPPPEGSAAAAFALAARSHGAEAGPAECDALWQWLSGRAVSSGRDPPNGSRSVASSPVLFTS